MAYTRTFDQLSLAVQQLGSWEGSADITPPILMQTINYALIEAFDVMVQKWADYYTLQLDFNLQPSVDTYSIDAIVSAGRTDGRSVFYKLRHLDWSSDGVRYHRMFPYDLDAQHHFSDSPTTTTRTKRRYRLQGGNLIVAPTPSAADRVRMYYIPLPPQFITDDPDDIDGTIKFDVPAEERLVVSIAYRDLLVRSDLSTVQAEQMIAMATMGLRTAADGRDAEPFYLDPRGPRDRAGDGWGWGED